MQQSDREDKIRRAIIIYAATGILLIGVIVATVAITPLYSRLKDNAENSLSHAVSISTIAVDEILSRAQNLVLQVTSRTQIRKRLEAYNRGDIELSELVAFTRDKLADAMNLSSEIVGITRLGPNGTRLIETGTALPHERYWPIPAANSHTTPIRGPVSIGETNYLLIGAHIFNKQGQQVGTDIIVFSLDSLRTVINDYTGLGKTGERVLAQVHNSEIQLLFPLRGRQARESTALSPNSPMWKALAQSTEKKSGTMHTEGDQGTQKIIAYAPLQSTDWGMAIKMDSDELFLTVNQQLLTIVFVISGLVLAGTFGVIWLVRPLSNTLHKELIRRKQAELALRQHQDHLEELVRGRTSALCNAYEEMESFSYSVSHDLRAPLRTINSFSQMLEEECGDQLDDTAADYLARIRKSAIRMEELTDGLLKLAHLSHHTLKPGQVDLSRIVRSKLEIKLAEQPQRDIDMQVDDVPAVFGDERLLGILVDNLIENAWKYTRHKKEARIQFGFNQGNNGISYFIRDNGAGFDMQFADNLFGVFQRLHSPDQFEGTGIGLATAKRIVDRHGGRIWAEASKDQGATFYFTLANNPHTLADDEWHSICA